MGNHELGITSRSIKKFRNGELHIHFESNEVDPEENIYLNYVLQIDASELVQGKSDKEIKALYYDLFGGYLTENIVLPTK